MKMSKKAIQILSVVLATMCAMGTSAFAAEGIDPMTGVAQETKVQTTTLSIDTTGEKEISTDGHTTTYQLADGSYRLEIGSGDKDASLNATEEGESRGIHDASMLGGVNSFYGKVNYENEEFLYSFYNATGYRVTYLRPNYAIPQGAKVIKAEMVLQTYTTGSIALGVREAKDTWKEDTITWDNQPGFSSKVTTQLAVNRNNTKYAFDLTNAVPSWMKKGAEWPGVVLYSGAISCIFYSSENSNVAARPVFNVYYTK